MLNNHHGPDTHGHQITTVAPDTVSPTAAAASGAPGSLHQALDRLRVRELLLLVADATRGRRSEALALLLGRGLDEIYLALEEAVRDHDHADLRNGAMEVLVAFGEASVPGLSRLLTDRDEEVRNLSAVMLGNIGSRRAVSALIEALEDLDPNVAHSAAEALGKIGDTAALDPLTGLLKGDLWVQIAAVNALGALGDERAVPQLIPLLDHGLLALPAAEALGKIGDTRALEPLSRIACSKDRWLAAAVAEAMGAIESDRGDTRAA